MKNAQKAGRPSRYRQGWRDAMARAAAMVRERATYHDDAAAHAIVGLAHQDIAGATRELAERIAAEPPPKKEKP